MTLILNTNTFDSHFLDTKNVAVISENFTYLIQQLSQYVDPGVSNIHDKRPDLIGGERRKTRGERSQGLGYDYKLSAGKLVTASGGTTVMEVFGTNVLIEEWTVSHPDVKDPQLGERYPTQDNATKKRPAEPRGPYTCKMTARISLSKKTPTRCYVQCNCKDFQTKFYEELNNKKYTLAQSLPQAKEPERLKPAICKHLYAIYFQHYRDLVKETEGGVVNESPVLFGPDAGPTPPPPPPPPPVKGVVAKTKQEAIDLILARLKQEYARLRNDKEAYFDTRTRKYAGGSYHLYPFEVVLWNGQYTALAYRNKTKADPRYKNNAAIQLIVIPDNPKIWGFFSRAKDQGIMSDLKRSLPEMPLKMQELLRKELGYSVHLESVEITTEVTDLSYLIEANGSSILSSISELS